jgi:hypothetical protein
LILRIRKFGWSWVSVDSIKGILIEHAVIFNSPIVKEIALNPITLWFMAIGFFTLEICIPVILFTTRLDIFFVALISGFHLFSYFALEINFLATHWPTTMFLLVNYKGRDLINRDLFKAVLMSMFFLPIIINHIAVHALMEERWPFSSFSVFQKEYRYYGSKIYYLDLVQLNKEAKDEIITDKYKKIINSRIYSRINSINSFETKAYLNKYINKLLKKKGLSYDGELCVKWKKAISFNRKHIQIESGTHFCWNYQLAK